jgi:hypothetical protein
MMMGSEKGSVLVIVITGITIIAAIGAGVASMINSSARTGVDQSLSVQALYAAESGLEWAGSELRKDFKISEDSTIWITTCDDWSGKTHPPIGQASFTITGEVLPDGCEVTVTGLVGSLASRKITATISKEFIESSGGSVKPPDDADEYGGVDVELPGLNIGKDETVSVKKGTTIDGNITIAKDSEVFFGDNVEVEGEISIAKDTKVYFGDNVEVTGEISIAKDSEVYFGDNVTLEGDISIAKDTKVYFGDNVEVTGEISIDKDSEVCFGDNVKISGKITLAKEALLCVGENLEYGSFSTNKDSKICSKDESSDYNCDDGYASECNELCEEPPELTGDDMSQDPVGTEDGAWSEG